MVVDVELPTTEQSELAQSALRQLEPILRTMRGLRPPDAEPLAINVAVPRPAFELLVELLGQIANGNAVTLVPVHAQLTTQQAADLLNVSRPHVVKLLERGELAYTKVGSHRRIRAEDLFAYRRRQEVESRAALTELSRLSQEMGLYE